MKEIFFPYKRVRSEIFGEILIPVVKAFLIGREEISVDIIVDSGAVISIFPKSLCDLLGLIFEEGKRANVRTATGEKIQIRIHKVKMRIGDFSFDARVAFCEIENIPYILGRLDVIDKVRIKFDAEGTSFLIE